VKGKGERGWHPHGYCPVHLYSCGEGEGLADPLTSVFGILTLIIHLGALTIIFWALKYYDALVVVTASDSFNIVVGALSGLLVLQESNFPPLAPVNLALYVVAVLIIVLGLIWILVKPCSTTDEPMPQMVACYERCGVRPPDEHGEGRQPTLRRSKSRSART